MRLMEIIEVAILFVLFGVCFYAAVDIGEQNRSVEETAAIIEIVEQQQQELMAKIRRENGMPPGH